MLNYRVIGSNNIEAKVIYVNDGSSDASHTILKQLQTENPDWVKVLSFSRNFELEAVMIAGIDYANGDAVICLDSDLQHPPALIPDIIKKHKTGLDIVNMVCETREDNGKLKNILSNRFFRKIYMPVVNCWLLFQTPNI